MTRSPERVTLWCRMPSSVRQSKAQLQNRLSLISPPPPQRAAFQRTTEKAAQTIFGRPLCRIRSAISSLPSCSKIQTVEDDFDAPESNLSRELPPLSPSFLTRRLCCIRIRRWQRPNGRERGDGARARSSLASVDGHTEGRCAAGWTAWSLREPRRRIERRRCRDRE